MELICRKACYGTYLSSINMLKNNAKKPNFFFIKEKMNEIYLNINLNENKID